LRFKEKKNNYLERNKRDLLNKFLEEHKEKEENLQKERNELKAGIVEKEKKREIERNKPNSHS